jgi:hypothetical protein
MLKTRDGTPIQRHRSPLVGCWFIQRSAEGRPVATGRIVKGVGPEKYLLAYTSREPSVAALTPTATAEQMEQNNFELWAHEAGWRRAFAGDESPRSTDEQVSTI